MPDPNELDDQMFSAPLGEHRALAVLRMLARFPGYTGNTLVIGSCLEYVGLPTSQTVIRSTLAFLEGQGLLTLKMAEDLIVVELSAAGLDAAKGLTYVAGVLRPPPQCPY